MPMTSPPSHSRWDPSASARQEQALAKVRQVSDADYLSLLDIKRDRNVIAPPKVGM